MIATAFANAADGIAREHALLQEGRPAVLLWQADENALVVPAALARRADMQAPIAMATEQGGRVVPRGSGGGIVPQGRCTLNLAMVFPCRKGFTLEDGFRLICGVLSAALARFGIAARTGACPGAFCDGAWNVMSGGRKLAGTAQRWRTTSHGRVVLSHAAILADRPDAALWHGLDALHLAAFPMDPPIRRSAHVTMNELLTEKRRVSSLSDALLRTAEDRLCAVVHREEEAA